MNCEDVIEKLGDQYCAPLDENERQRCVEHAADCEACRNALEAMDAMRLLREQASDEAAPGLFDETMGWVKAQSSPSAGTRRGFWLGTAVGGAVAAAFFAAGVGLVMLQQPKIENLSPVEFVVSMEEARNLNIAIDADSDLTGATLSVSLYGGVELAGFTGQRHLSWTADLEAGVNKLSLPVIATDNAGGQVVVRLEHSDSRREYLIELLLDA